MINAVLFDFDGVLTTDATGSQSIFRYIAQQCDIDIEKFKQVYYKYNKDLICGNTTHADIWENLCTDLGADIPISVLYDSFINTPIDEKMIDIAYKLKENGYKIGMITDNKCDRIDSIIAHHKWNDLFDTLSISADCGSGKRQQDIFINALDKLRENAEKCVFIDNKMDNLTMPKTLGMATLFFDDAKRDIQKLVGDIQKLKVNI